MAKKQIDLYDDSFYNSYFWKQPYILEIQIGEGLIPFLSERAHINDEITNVRQKIIEEYGLPIPLIHICDNIYYKLNEFSISLYGNEVIRKEVCLRKDFFPTPEKEITESLVLFFHNNITKILNQNMVNILVNKVRSSNPDVIDDVFFNHLFPTSSMKKVLNRLMADHYSIFDMNTILETIADNISQSQEPEFLANKIKEQFPIPFK